MVKVMIVEDEVRVAQLINKLIPWNELGMELASISDNGITAFNRIISEKPDIVITDIRMPGFEGIELIKKVRELHLETSFIVISGYQHFEYAHSALKYGVEDYLLKPIKKDELSKVLFKLRDKFVEKSELINVERKMTNQLATNTKKLRQIYLSNIWSGQWRPKQLDEINDEYHFQFKDGYFQGFVLKIDHQTHENVDSIVDNKIYHALIKSIYKYLENKCYEIETIVQGSKIIFLLNYTEQNIVPVKQELELILQEAQTSTGLFTGFHLTLGVGTLETDINFLYRTLQKSWQAILCRTIIGVDKVIDYVNIQGEETSIKQFITTQQIYQFTHFIEAVDINGIQDWVHKVLQKGKERSQAHPIIFFTISESILNLFNDAIKNWDINIKNYPTEIDSINRRMENAISANDMVDFLIDFMIQFLETHVVSKKEEGNRPIRLAKLYISKNYSENISLEEIGEFVNLNPVYLSVMFKKEVGINFSDYLIHYRMKLAKEFLQNTNYNISEIANQVGYKDAKHFSKLFSKIVGIKPTEYRKIYTR